MGGPLVRVRSAVREDADGQWYAEVHEWEDDAKGGPVDGMPLAPPDSIARLGPFPDGDTAHAFVVGPLREALARGPFDRRHFNPKTWAELEATGAIVVMRGRS